MMEATRTKETEGKYKKQYARLVKAALKDYPSKPGTRTLPDRHKACLYKHLLSKAKSIRPSTLRQYKAAVIFVWSELDPTDHWIQKIKDIRGVSSEERKKLPHKTSSAKAKSISLKDYEKIDRQLEMAESRKNSIYSRIARVWLPAGMLTGLRPCEWKSAVVIENENQLQFLQAVNAKATNGRANGKIRHIDITSLNQQNIQCINQMIMMARHYDSVGEFEKLEQGCQRAMKKAARLGLGVRKKYPTLYTARHQFCANAKFAGLSLRAVAALMGHATDQTASRHYGKRRVGRSGLRVKPVNAEVAQVRNVSKTRVAIASNSASKNKVKSKLDNS